MSINFSTHSLDLQKAYKDTLDPANPLNWALFSYGQGTDLKLVGQGGFTTTLTVIDGGLEELKDEFEGGKIQFAFARVVEPVSNRSKYILISWCGEGVPTARKGLFNVHEVSNYFHLSNLQIQARYEEDVEPDAIMAKIKLSSGFSTASAPKPVSNVQSKPASYNPPPFKAASASTYNYSKPAVELVSSYSPPIAKTQEEAKPLYAPSTSSYVPVKTAPKPLSTPAAFKSSFEKLEEPKPAGGSIGSRSQAFKLADAATGSNYQPVKLTPRPMYGDYSTAPLTGERKVSAGLSGSANNLSNGKSISFGSTLAGSQNSLSKSSAVSPSSSFKNLSAAYGSQTATYEAKITPNYNISPRTSETRRLQDEKVAEQRKQEERLAEQRRQEGEQSNASSNERDQLALSERMEQVRIREQEANKIQRAQLEREQAERDNAEKQKKIRKEEEERARRYADERVKEAETFRVQQESQLPQSRVQLSAALYQQVQPELTQSNLTATALYDYTPDESNEIALMEGEFVTEIVQADEGWWEGCNSRGERGFFPSNYVEIMAKASPTFRAPTTTYVAPIGHSATDVAPATHTQINFVDSVVEGKKAIALFDYLAAEENELTFAEGEIITDLDFVSEEWWSGRVHGKIGLFPASYCQLSS